MEYFNELSRLFKKIEARDDQRKVLPAKKAILRISNLIIEKNKIGNKIILIGNGGSASIASHIAIDFLKNASIPAEAFNDASLLTCISNDLGYEYVFQKPIEMLGKENDILFSISSSGASRNILNATYAARKKKFFIITLSGFDKNNALRALGDLNFYLPSNSYGYVEIIHLAICHAIVDNVILGKA